MSKKIYNQFINRNLQYFTEGIPKSRNKSDWRQSQRDLPIGEKVALLGQTIMETLEFERIKKHAKSL